MAGPDAVRNAARDSAARVAAATASDFRRKRYARPYAGSGTVARSGGTVGTGLVCGAAVSAALCRRDACTTIGHTDPLPNGNRHGVGEAGNTPRRILDACSAERSTRCVAF